MRNLPPRLHLKNGGYYYVFKNKWEFLSRDFPQALRLYADRMEQKNTGTLPDVIDRALKRKKLAANTMKAYYGAAKHLKAVFEEFDPSQFRPTHFYQFIAGKKVSDNMAQLYRSVMIAAMDLAVEEGQCDRNLMREVRNWKGRRRSRYLTDQEYLAIRERANPTLRAIMAISLQTGQRIGDVLKMGYADLIDDGIFVEQIKTKQKLCVKWTADLREAVAIAKATHTSVKGLTLFAGKSGQPLPYSTVLDWWLKATELAGIDANMHDIRAKTATDARKIGLNSKGLLGHATDSAHERYQRGNDVPLVEPLPMVKG